MYSSEQLFNISTGLSMIFISNGVLRKVNNCNGECMDKCTRWNLNLGVGSLGVAGAVLLVKTLRN